MTPSLSMILIGTSAILLNVTWQAFRFVNGGGLVIRTPSDVCLKFDWFNAMETTIYIQTPLITGEYAGWK